MILYHGSNIAIDRINLSLSKPYKDFGKGFYATDIRSQAEGYGKASCQADRFWKSDCDLF